MVYHAVFRSSGRFVAASASARHVLHPMDDGGAEMLTTSMYAAALLVASGGALLRGATVVLAFGRTFLLRRRFVSFRMGWVETLCMPEPLVLLGVAWGLSHAAGVPVSPTAGAVVAASAGAVLVLAGWGLLLWSFRSWPSVFAGHGVLDDHRLVTSGAYGAVRHPVYLAAFLIWIGLALAFRSPGALLVTVLYVIPTYLLYMRSEEQMMGGAFGEAYREYRRNVPMLLPRLHRTSRGTGVAVSG
jgi:protein-S-isoprenylcysteine O-methyltransferase Ste14